VKQASSGKVKTKWQTKEGIPETPWMSIDHSNSTNMGLWLHKEIMDWYEFVKPRPFEQFIREKLVEDLREKIRQGFRYPADVHTFGSFPAGLYLPTSDMDLVCLSEQFMQHGRQVLSSKGTLWKFRDFLLDARLPMRGTVEVIAGAKVPLVKYVDGTTGLKVDISFENETGLIANNTFQEWKTQFPAMPILVTLIKHLLAMRGLNEPVNGGIGGFSVTCLVVSLLQHMPQVQSRTMIPEHHLGEILMEFLDLYGNQFNTETTALVLNPPSYVSKAQALGDKLYRGNNQQSKFCIMDPNREDNDISGGSSNTPTIRRVFSDSYERLQKRMAELAYSSERQNQSILSVIIGGDYTSFKQQRDHLAHIHETLFGPVAKYD
jgi:non-canonical poly(A) RNA polymerase PAPD5/7